MDKETERRKQEEDLVRRVIMIIAIVIAAVIFLSSYQENSLNINIIMLASDTAQGNAVEEGPTAVEDREEEDGFSEEIASASAAENPESGLQEVLVEKSIDINRADEKELDKLPGIGPVLAERIVQYREENGGFYDIEELKDVQGIGDKIFLKIQDFVFVE